jgi:hypothetical protein
MNSNYKHTILSTLLSNPSVSPEVKERILRLADDSWDWLSALTEGPLPKQCTKTIAELLEAQLAKAIESGLAKKDPEDSEFHLDNDVLKAIEWFIEQTGVSVNTVRPILEKFEQNNLWWSYYKPIIDAALKNNDSRDGFIRFFVSSKKRYFTEEIASNPGTPPEILESLAQSPIPEVLRAVADNPAASNALLRSLCEDHWELVTRHLASNPNLPEEFVERIARSDDRFPKVDLIGRDDLNDDVVRILSADEDEYIRGLVSQRVMLPSDVIARLVRDPEESVRAKIAERGDLSAELIQDLYQSRSVKIDRALAANPAITDEMRDAFVQSNDKELLGAAFANPRLTKVQLAKLSKEKNKSWVKTWLYTRERLCVEALDILATIKHAEARERMAYMAELPDTILAKLAVDVDAEVRTAVAVHPKCTDALLKEIISRHDEDGDFHLPLRISESNRSAEILELMFDKLLQVHHEAITEYKKLRADGATTFIVPRDFRSLKRFYENPLASEQLKTAVTDIYEHFAEHNKGLALAERLAEGSVTLKATQKTLSENFSAEDCELFLAGFASSTRLGDEVVDFLLKKSPK